MSIPGNTGLMSRGDSLISWGEGSSLALVGNPSRDGVSIKILVWRHLKPNPREWVPTRRARTLVRQVFSTGEHWSSPCGRYMSVVRKESGVARRIRLLWSAIY